MQKMRGCAVQWCLVAAIMAGFMMCVSKAAFAEFVVSDQQASSGTSEKIEPAPSDSRALTFAGDNEKTQSTLLKKTIKLEDENRVLRQDVAAIKEQIQRMQNSPAQSSSSVSGASINTASGLGVQVYGYVKADAIYGDTQIGELTMSAPLDTKDENQFFITAKETRVGLNITGPQVGENGKLTAKVEGDFWGNTSDSIATPALRLRQAYVDLSYPSWGLLAGQAWDFFSPLNPSTLDFAVLWRAGNLGDRHTQVRLTKTVENVLGSKFTQQVGILDSRTTEQENTGAPLVGSYSSIERKLFGQPLLLGAGGAYGKSDISTTNSRHVTMWCATLVAKYRLLESLSLMGEGYMGSDLAAFRAGSPTGIDHNKAVRTRGGWAQLTFKPKGKVQYNFGAGVDQPYTDSDSTGANAVWQSNVSYFGNVKYEIAKNLWCGLEYQYFITRYLRQNDVDATRLQTSIIYNF
jgi:hypothetical protein